MTGSRLRVVIVDDTADLRLLVRLVLERDGRFAVVGEAGDGLAAIRAAEEHQADILLLDLSMPAMDGLEALPEIRARAPQTKIVVLSGFNAAEMEEESLRRGASSYLEKGGIAGRLVPHILALFAQDEHPPAVPAIPAPRARPDAGEELISTLVHELLSPMTVLLGFASVLSDGVETMDPAMVKRSAESIARATRHLDALVRAFSDVRRIEVDSLDLQVERTDLARLVRETVADMAELTRAHPVVVEAPAELQAGVDPLRVRQVLINLLVNAGKFAPAGSRIDVTLVPGPGASAEISVRDHGPGIPPGKRAELFGKFARLGSTRPGTGLGLYLSRAIARAHGGDLVLDASETPGCRFTLQLPLGAVHTDPQGAEQHAAKH